MHAKRLVIGGAFLWLSTANAWTGGPPLRTGLVWVGSSQTYGCPVLNASNKLVTHLISRIRDASGVVHCVNPCDELEPADVCDATCTSVSAPGFVYCEIEADQPGKPLRATLLNVTTGASSEAR